MHGHHSKGTALGGLALLCLLATGGANAQPYEFLAVYEPTAVGTTSKAIRLDLGQGALVPDGGEGLKLDRIVVRFKSDSLSGSALSTFKRMRFTVNINGSPSATKEIFIQDIDKLSERELVLLPWRGDGKAEALSHLSIDVQSIYLREYLCLQELALLGREPRADMPLVPLQEPSRSGKSSRNGGTPPERRSIKAEDGPWLLYSFCLGEDGESRNKQVSWKKALEIQEFKFNEMKLNADEGTFREAHKRALAKLIVEQINKSFATFGRSSFMDTKEEGFDNVLIQVPDSRAFSILKSVGSMLLIEESGGDIHRLVDLIDQDSEVALELAREVCFQLPPGAMMSNPWIFELEVPDGEEGKTRKAKVELGFRHGCNRVLQVPWKDYLNQRVIFRVIYRVPDLEDIVLFKDSFTVYNLGLISTAPGFTEVISAYQQSSPRDVEATSSIPVSYALPVGGGQRSGSLAVTFPFTLSFNTPEFPNLADYFAVAPSISLLGGGQTPAEDASAGESPPVEQGPNVRLAVGVGVKLARAFHFGYAWAPSDGGRYVLIGISVPDLLPLFRSDP